MKRRKRSARGMINVDKVPKVSVIVPVYNVEKYLEQCLDSLLAQTLQNIEIICVDDASTDGSLRILKKYVGMHENIKIVCQQDNLGQSAARNLGLSVARGEFIYFCDSDDYLLENTLETLVRRAEKDNLDIVFFDLFPFADDGDELKIQNVRKYYSRNKNYLDTYTGISLFCQMKDNNDYLCQPCSYMTRSSYLLENHIKFYEGIIHEDELFTLQLMAKAKRCGYVSEQFYRRRMHSNSTMTKDKSLRNVKGYVTVIWYGSELLKNDFLPTEKECLFKHLSFLRRYAKSIYEALSQEEKKRICELPVIDRMRIDVLMNESQTLIEKQERQTEVPSEQRGVLVYGVGDHLKDMLDWHPELNNVITRLFDKNKAGFVYKRLGLTIEGQSEIKNLPAGTVIAIAAIRYYDEIAAELKKINPNVISEDIDVFYAKNRKKFSNVKSSDKKVAIQLPDIKKQDSKSDPVKQETLTNGYTGDGGKYSNHLCGIIAQNRWRQDLMMRCFGLKRIFWGVKGRKSEWLQKKLCRLFHEGDIFIDEDKKLWGRRIYGMTICSPEVIDDIKEEFIIIILDDNYDEIKNKLIGMGLIENYNFLNGRLMVL